jgi:hypothetical protein
MIKTQNDARADVRAGFVYAFSKEEPDLDTAEAFDIYIETGDYALEIEAEYEAMGGSVGITFYSDTVITADTGTAIIPVNQCELCKKTAKTVVLFNPTVTSAGTAVRSRKVRSAANVPSRSNTSIGDPVQRVLKPNSTHLIRCVAAVNDVDFGAYVRITERP